MSTIYPIERGQGNDIIEYLDDIADTLHDIGEYGIVELIGSTGLVYQLTEEDKENIAEILTIPTATTSRNGIVRPDGTTIKINNQGVLSIAFDDADNIRY